MACGFVVYKVYYNKIGNAMTGVMMLFTFSE